MDSQSNTVVILGAGINGAALARELALNRVPVMVVDTADIASGTTAYSSRLIHGGLRYLEYGEFDLVRESLAERTRWLQLAPHLVKPLQLFIPVGNWWGGLWSAARRFLHLPKKPSPRPSPHSGEGMTKPRGLVTVRTGLWLYDRYARDPSLSKSRVHKVGTSQGLPVDAKKYAWLCSYMDAQVLYPERMTVELLQDAAQAAQESGTPFEVLTYHRATIADGTVTIRSLRDPHTAERSITPAAIVNATGAWVDQTLATLHVPEKQLIGGTKGSHFVTHQQALKQTLDGRAIYAEAADGRPVFVMPFGEGTLVGTTDEPFHGDPHDALATEVELDYLVRAVNEVLPDVRLTRADIDLHYCGVRPLPYSDASLTAAITRRHWLHEHANTPIPMFSIIGGKLTTCRSLAQAATATILPKLGLAATVNSQARPLLGGEKYPQTGALVAEEWQRLATRFGLHREQVKSLWSLFGMQTRELLRELTERGEFSPANLAGTELPRCIVRWVARHEWAATLGDLVERRLMLLYHPRLSLATLNDLADELIAVHRLAPDNKETEMGLVRERLRTRFGKQLVRKEEH